MTSRWTRTWLTAILAAGLLFLGAATTVPSVPESLPEPPPSREEIQALEELARWMHGDRRMTLFSPRDVTDAMRQGRRSFELFRSFTGKRAHIELLRDVPYGAAIYDAAERHGLDSLLVAAIVQAESGFRAEIRSPVGAVGLMQVMPDTGALYGIANLTDPSSNLDVGSRYFSDLLDLYAGDLELALAAYNAGPGNVDRYNGIPPFPETRTYVKRVLRAYVGNHKRAWTQSGAADQLRLP